MRYHLRIEEEHLPARHARRHACLEFLLLLVRFFLFRFDLNRKFTINIYSIVNNLGRSQNINELFKK